MKQIAQLIDFIWIINVIAIVIIPLKIYLARILLLLLQFDL